MDDSISGGFPGRIPSSFDSFRPHRAPHVKRYEGNRRENGLPASWQGGRRYGHNINPIMPQAMMAYQERFLGSPSHPAPYTSPGGHADGFHGMSQGLPPQLPPRNYHTPSSLLVSGHPTVNSSEVSYGFPLVRQAVQELGVSMNSIQPPSLSPRAGINVLPIRKRRVDSYPCPVLGCPTSFGRAQDQRRHLLTHLPRWIHCPAPDCPWRGDRLSAFVRHWGREHPSSSQVPQEDQCKIYDPLPLMKGIVDGSVCIQAAQNHAISMVQKKASVLGKPELFENPWGRKPRKPRKVQ